MPPIRTLFRSLALLALVAAPLSAQAPGQVVLRGNVVDAESRTPVFGAFVAGADERTGVLTDSLGRFALPIDRAERYPIRVRQLGYRSFGATMPKEAEGRAFTVGLEPDPIEIEGLTVLGDRLADRRRGPWGVTTILDQSALLRSPLGTASELLRQVMPFAQPCTFDADSLCYSNQGRRTPVSVCVDSRAVPNDSPELDALDPRGMYLVEAYPRTGQVRFYTRGYVERLIQTGQELPPITFGCSGAMPPL